MARTQADRDDNLAIGRELERKDAKINRLRGLLWIAVLNFEAENGVVLTNPDHWTVQAKAVLGGGSEQTATPSATGKE